MERQKHNLEQTKNMQKSARKISRERRIYTYIYIYIWLNQMTQKKQLKHLLNFYSTSNIRNITYTIIYIYIYICYCIKVGMK